MKKARIRFGTILVLLLFVAVVVILSLLQKNKGNVSAALDDLKYIFGG